MAESFSSPGGVSGERPQNAQATGEAGINHASIGTQFDHYNTGVSAPTNNPEVTQQVDDYVRTPEPFSGTVGSYPGLYGDVDSD